MLKMTEKNKMSSGKDNYMKERLRDKLWFEMLIGFSLGSLVSGMIYLEMGYHWAMIFAPIFGLYLKTIMFFGGKLR